MGKTHMCLWLFIEEAPYDKMLSWPFQGAVKIELLNQLTDKNHHSTILIPTETDNLDTGKIYVNKRFIRQDRLQGPSDRQSLIDDTLYFRFTASTAAIHKPWLICTDL